MRYLLHGFGGGGFPVPDNGGLIGIAGSLLPGTSRETGTTYKTEPGNRSASGRRKSWPFKNCGRACSFVGTMIIFPLDTGNHGA